MHFARLIHRRVRPAFAGSDASHLPRSVVRSWAGADLTSGAGKEAFGDDSDWLLDHVQARELAQRLGDLLRVAGHGRLLGRPQDLGGGIPPVCKTSLS